MTESDTAMADTAVPPVVPLQRVPLEVLLRITYFLTTPELSNVRLTCRSIERSLDTTFVNEFFFRKQFMLSDESLQALIDIAKSRLGPYLRKVHFGLEHYPNVPYPTGEDDKRDEQLIARHAGMFTLWSTGYHRDMLVEAFQNLKNLEDVVIRSFNSTSRSRDGPGAEWTSYGSTTANQETGYSTTQFCSQVFAAVIAALGQAEARPKGIEVMARGRHQLKNCAFNIPPYMETSVLPVLKNLEKLHLDVDLTSRSKYGREGQNGLAAASSMLRKFLSHATNVKHLRINCMQVGLTADTSLLDWLASPTTAGIHPNSPAAVALPGPSFPHLEELNLGRMRTDALRVLEIVHKFAPTLKRFELQNIVLERPPLSNHFGPNPKIKFWAQFLTNLRGIPGLNLHHIALRNLQQRWTNSSNKCRVSFNGESHMAYTGPDWKHFVNDTIPQVEVDYRNEEELWNQETGINDPAEDDASEDSSEQDSDEEEGDGENSEGENSEGENSEGEDSDGEDE